jgi:hypothetical protein
VQSADSERARPPGCGLQAAASENDVSVVSIIGKYSKYKNVPWRNDRNPGIVKREA